MESWAYLQAESLISLDPVGPFPEPRLFRRMNWKKLSSLACFYLLTAALTLSILSSTLPALAVLTKGSQGAAVRTLQLQLRDAGFFSGPVTGFYGSLTESAVRRFQAQRGLVVDGIAGNSTLAALGGRTRSGSSVPGTGTLELQQLLASQGFYAGPLDGVYGSGTRTAVRSAQQSYGLTVDGIAGPITLAALRRRGGKARGQTTDGSSTAELQKLLANQGFYDGPIDGVYGATTRRAVRAAQQAYGLAVDGVAGPATMAALRRQGGSRSSQTNQSTIELQQLLAERGFYQGQIDGIYGSGTRSAVRAAQAQYGLVVDGVAGPATVTALRRGSPAQRSAQTPEPVTSQASNQSKDVLPVPAPPPPVRSGDATTVSRQGEVQTAGTASTSNVSYLQQLLTRRGFYQGSIDGVYGPQTRAAVLAAQRSYGLVADGIAGPQTLRALERGG